MRELLAQIYLFFQCRKTFQKGWFNFFLDAIRERNGYAISEEIHSVGYGGRQLYYRIGRKDILLIICILVKKIQYNFDVPLYEDDNVLDLGANIGLFTIRHMQSCTSQRNSAFIAVEPEPENYKILKMNLDQYPNAIAVNAGIWWRRAYLEIVNQGGGSWAFQVKETKDGNIKGESIDSLCERYGVKPSVIKMDIEGSEKYVFDHVDGAKWIDFNKMLIIETHEMDAPGVTCLVRETMTKYGYSVSKKGEDFIFRR